MSIQFLPGKLEGQERKEIIQEVQKQLQEAVVEVIRPLLTAFCEAEQKAKLGREKRRPRHVSGQIREIDWQCGHCGCRDANQFTRDGHYRRALETGWGHIKGLQVPMLECQRCGHDVVCTYTILEKYQRFWLDLNQQVLFGSGLCQSLRHLSQEWSAKLDKRQRKRHQRTGKKVVLLVALGFWTDGSGKREVLDWQVADNEGKAAWETLVNRLWERGVQPEKGLQAVIRDGCGELGEALALVYGSTVVEQRCIFHQLRNVADKCREELKGDANKETRKQLLEQASVIYQADSSMLAGRRKPGGRPLTLSTSTSLLSTLNKRYATRYGQYPLV